MAKYFIPAMEVEVSKSREYTDIYRKGTLIFTSDKVHIFKILLPNVFAIIEDYIYRSDESKITFFHLDEDDEIKTTSFCICSKHGDIFDDRLLEEKELIIPSVYKKFLYSYEYDSIISDLYDTILYEEETNTFHVEKVLSTEEGCVRLFGTLNIDGFLLNESMYIPDIDLEVYVDPLNLEKSLKENILLIEKKLKKKRKEKKIHELFEFEEEIYLKRKKRKNWHLILSIFSLITNFH